MRVVVPYVDGRLHPDTAAVVLDSGLPHLFAQLDPLDPGAYGRLVRTLWAAGEAFAIVEHDVVPTAAQLHELARCHGRWCSFPYDDELYPDGPMFGCVKFSARTLAEHPHAAEVALVVGRRKDQECVWWNVDNHIARDLQIRGVTWHRHSSPVHHAHVGPPSGTWA